MLTHGLGGCGQYRGFVNIDAVTGKYRIQQQGRDGRATGLQCFGRIFHTLSKFSSRRLRIHIAKSWRINQFYMAGWGA